MNKSKETVFTLWLKSTMSKQSVVIVTLDHQIGIWPLALWFGAFCPSFPQSISSFKVLLFTRMLMRGSVRTTVCGTKKSVQCISFSEWVMQNLQNYTEEMRSSKKSSVPQAEHHQRGSQSSVGNDVDWAPHSGSRYRKGNPYHNGAEVCESTQCFWESLLPKILRS